jgi:hypothetical protein
MTTTTKPTANGATAPAARPQGQAPGQIIDRWTKTINGALADLKVIDEKIRLIADRKSSDRYGDLQVAASATKRVAEYLRTLMETEEA